MEGTKPPWMWSSVRSILDWILVASALGDEWYNCTPLELQHKLLTVTGSGRELSRVESPFPTSNSTRRSWRMWVLFVGL